ncbi:MAG: hypothetical protein MUO26_02865 [Methanotrichaceae archaeon]|nr:hypothetical protein [Methanotrichaceae archaeon]
MSEIIYKVEISVESIRNVIEIFLKNPQKYHKYKDISNNVGIKYGETSIRNVLRILERTGILKSSYALGRPTELELGVSRKGKGKKKRTRGRPPDFYKINLEKLGVFHTLLRDYYKDTAEDLLASNFVAQLIRSFGFIPVYEAAKSKLKDNDLKRTVSKLLLSHSSTTEEYQEIPNYIRKSLLGDDINKSNNTKYEIQRSTTPSVPVWSQSMSLDNTYLYYDYDDPRYSALNNLESKIRTAASKHIQILKQFDPLHAVSFYRRVIHGEMLDLFDELSKRSIISSGINEFIQYDNYLNPFNSYPTYGPRFLIFSRPFQRIYDDYYLLEYEDIIHLELRANAIFSNFVDIIFEFLRNFPPKNKNMLEEIIKQLIYQWNVASTNFESIDLILESIYKKENGSGKYHVRSEGIALNIIDLETGRSVLDADNCSLRFESLAIDFDAPWTEFGSYMKNPFDYITSCIYLQIESNSENLIPATQIISDLTSKFAEYGWDYDNIKT